MPSRPASPNRGFTVQDILDTGEVSITQSDFRQQYGVDSSLQIRIVKLVFMRYEVPDLLTAKTFLKDFGLTKVKETETDIWFRGYGGDQYVYHLRRGPKRFLGGAFEVESAQELEKALQIPGVTVLSNGIESLESAPGGGQIVTLADAEGFPINLIYGIKPGEVAAIPGKMVFNDEIQKPRQREFARFKPGPAAVHKLGHYGLVVRDFEAQFAFYTKHFNFMPTSVLFLDEDGQKTNVGMFAHVDRGDELVDHHTLFMVTLPPGHEKPHPHHCSFEIHDFDAQAMGHDWLLKKGYDPVWGLGRHILGSQIFDYWWDPNGFMVEHYIDGDIVNKETPVSFHLAASAKDAAWGSEVPGPFLE